MRAAVVLGIIMASLSLAACTIWMPTPSPAPAPTATPELGAAAGASDSKCAPALAATGGVVKQYNSLPSMAIDPSANYTATIKTNCGAITVKLFAKETPITVNNFVFLAKDGYYDGVIFHRVIPDFMIQGGDPTGTGSGGPDYKFQDETAPSLTFAQPGILAMANAGPGTNGSQFFITLAPTPHLNGAHTIFGRVVEGQDVVDAIGAVGTDARDRPTQPVTIQTIDVVQSGG